MGSALAPSPLSQFERTLAAMVKELTLPLSNRPSNNPFRDSIPVSSATPRKAHS